MALVPPLRQARMERPQALRSSFMNTFLGPWREARHPSATGSFSHAKTPRPEVFRSPERFRDVGSGRRKGPRVPAGGHGRDGGVNPSHPWIEQTHWHPLRQQTPFAHPVFAGYHILVLTSLTTWPWMAFVFLILMLVSWLWGLLCRHTKSLTPAYVSHALADLGIVIAAWMRT